MGHHLGMAGGLTIEPATLADADAIASIYAHHVRHGTATFEIEPPDTAEMAGRMDKVSSAGWPWLVARDGAGTVLGYAYAGAMHARAAYRYTCEDSVYVRHDALGRGIGSALLAALIEASAACGFRQMIALISATEQASLALHARFGFGFGGQQRSVGRKHGRWIDVAILQRALGEGDATPPPEEPA